MKFTFFYSGPFSQWYPCRFTMLGTEFNCAEQAMMYYKAMLFGDHNIQDLVLQANGPKEMKQFGRMVKNFEQKKWDKFKYNLVVNINYRKFKQNQFLLNKLEETRDTILVEASPSDTIWGIGLSMTDPDRFYETKWRGQNLLGKALTEVRMTIFGA